jgi:AraC family transcriptional regulator, carnitine catabolism transcriptional activator
VIFVFASFVPAETANDRRLCSWLRRRARASVRLGGIENGSLALAAAGLLDGQAVAVHWDNLEGFRELFPKVNTSDALYCISENRMTCAGGVVIPDRMVAWMNLNGDAALARDVGRQLLLDRARLSTGRDASGRVVGSGGTDPVVTKACDLILAKIDETITAAAVASEVGLSQRQLQSRFHRELGHPIHKEIELLRMERAHQYLQQTTMSVTEVGIACGYSSVEYFGRLYRRVFGRPPSSDRRQSTSAPVFSRDRQ